MCSSLWWWNRECWPCVWNVFWKVSLWESRPSEYLRLRLHQHQVHHLHLLWVNQRLGGILAVVEILMHICLQVNLHWANVRCKWDMRWITCWSIKCSNTSNSRAVQGSDPGWQDGSRKEMRMDEKWIPAARRVAAWKLWSSRGRELAGFKSWFEQFSGWYCLIHDSFGPELREAINSQRVIQRFFFCCALIACHEGRRRSPSVSEIGEKTDLPTFHRDRVGSDREPGGYSGLRRRSRPLLSCHGGFEIPQTRYSTQSMLVNWDQRSATWSPVRQSGKGVLPPVGWRAQATWPT